MSRSSIGRLIVATLTGIVCALMFVVVPALAAGTSGGGSGTSILPVQTPTAAPVTLPPPYLPTDQFNFALIVILVFGLLLIGGLLWYIYRIQQRYYSLVRTLSQIGRRVTAVQVGLFDVADHVQNVTASVQAQAIPLKDLKIEGPATMTVGTSGDFKATGPDDQPANTAQWSVTPTEAASVNPASGAKVSVNPKMAGAFKLNVSQAPDAAGELLVAVSAPEPTAEDLPFVGLGFGALVIAILVVVAVIVLALTGSLQGEAVATLLGGLLGYIFGVNVPTAARASQASSSKTTNTTS